ncbi:hypothetical protein [Campylobacter hyointestinalis]|uniref:hypothetical protein n=1 Tax=Campylobacter hyointestinalis TaxID=198 RepID=UPI000DCCF9FE|nr:hypothetical protein [Campylobacter hyointestinalis]RAZ38028.1 hypothetical protein CHL9426_07075 [Campylobacter hyointestinalis subsp. lawsonii]RAZ54667.1 hypothetical protein CHL10074_06765 [Campylobacter hyointestinalis subsp. lawsonii]RAZ63349.1 hypothetical protein CHL9767_06860 [Campylobacter hyointestinalis subsp. lawsonii]
MFFTNSEIKEKIFARLNAEIEKSIDDKKYVIRRRMRENLNKKAQDRNADHNSPTYKLLYEMAEEEIDFLIADVEWYKTLLEKEKSKKWYEKLLKD